MLLHFPNSWLQCSRGDRNKFWSIPQDLSFVSRLCYLGVDRDVSTFYTANNLLDIKEPTHCSKRVGRSKSGLMAVASGAFTC